MKQTLKHTVERVPQGYKIDRSMYRHHERHTLVCGAVTAHGTSLKDCQRLLNIRVHGA